MQVYFCFYKEFSSAIGRGIVPREDLYLEMIKFQEDKDREDTEKMLLRFEKEIQTLTESEDIISFFNSIFDRLFEKFGEPLQFFFVGSREIEAIYHEIFNQTEYNLYYAKRVGVISTIKVESTCKKKDFKEVLDSYLETFRIPKKEISATIYLMNEQYEKLKESLDLTFPNFFKTDKDYMDILKIISSTQNFDSFLTQAKTLACFKDKKIEVTKEEYPLIFEEVYAFYRLYQLL